MQLNRIEKRLLICTTSILLLSACSPQPEKQVPVNPISSTIPALVSPAPIPTQPPTPEVKPTPEPTPTVQESLPVYTEGRNGMSVQGFSAAAPDSVLNLAGIQSVSLAPEKLTQMRKYFLVTWASEMAKRPDLVSSIPGLKNFVGMTSDKSLDVLMKAFDDNAKLGTSGFQFEFDFGNKVKGKVDSINIKTTGSEAEWQSVIDNIRKEGITFNVVKPPFNGTLKNLIYIKNNTIYIRAMSIRQITI